MLHAHSQNHSAAFVGAAFFGGDGEGFAGFFDFGDGFQLHICAQIQRLLNQLLGKLGAADLNGAGDILHLGRIGNLAAKAVLFDDQDGLAGTQCIYSSGQSGRATAYNNNIVHKKFLQSYGPGDARPIWYYREARYFLISGTL